MESGVVLKYSAMQHLMPELKQQIFFLSVSILNRMQQQPQEIVMPYKEYIS